MQRVLTRLAGFSAICFAAALLIISIFISSLAYADTKELSAQERVIDQVLQAQDNQSAAKSEKVEAAAHAIDGTGVEPKAADEESTKPEEGKQDEEGKPTEEEPKDDEAVTRGVWEHSSAGWRYLVNNVPSYGFIEDDGKTYYLDPNTGVMHTGWVKIEGIWYFFNGSGAMHTGWLLSGGKWYYLDPADGKMKTGVYKVGGDWYLSNSSGAMHANGWVKTADGWYFAAGSGALKTGWLLTGGKWYYLDPAKSGLMLVGKHEIGKATYLLDPSGAMKTGWVLDGADWYHFNGSGAMTTGWVWLGVWYYLNPSDGVMKTGKFKVSKDLYIANASGAMLTGWVKLPEGWYYAVGSGELKTGWLSLGGVWYWLDPTNDGLMAEDGMKTVNGVQYLFDASGAMAANRFLKLDDGKCAYADSSGAVNAIGVYDGDKVVLKDKDGNTVKGWQKFGTSWFYGDENGNPKTGWLDDGGKWYWLQESGAMATNAWVDGGKYYVGAEGTWRPYANDAASAKILAAAGRVGFQGGGYCARWVDCVYMAAGYRHFDGDARDFYWQKCTISDLNLLEPGMVIGVPSHTHTALGKIYGHVAIYMGNGMVRENLNSVVDTPLSSWLAYYQTTYPAKCGWAF